MSVINQHQPLDKFFRYNKIGILSKYGQERFEKSQAKKKLDVLEERMMNIVKNITRVYKVRDSGYNRALDSFYNSEYIKMYVREIREIKIAFEKEVKEEDEATEKARKTAAEEDEAIEKAKEEAEEKVAEKAKEEAEEKVAEKAKEEAEELQDAKTQIADLTDKLQTAEDKGKYNEEANARITEKCKEAEALRKKIIDLETQITQLNNDAEVNSSNGESQPNTNKQPGVDQPQDDKQVNAGDNNTSKEIQKLHLTIESLREEAEEVKTTYEDRIQATEAQSKLLASQLVTIKETSTTLATSDEQAFIDQHDQNIQKSNRLSAENQKLLEANQTYISTIGEIVTFLKESKDHLKTDDTVSEEADDKLPEEADDKLPKDAQIRNGRKTIRDIKKLIQTYLKEVDGQLEHINHKVGGNA